MSSAPSRSSADPLADALAGAVAALQHAVRALAVANPVVLIDGRSGAGKTTLARMLHERWGSRTRVQSLALDAVYPGWDGLRAGADYARERVLLPHARGEVGVWERWDWERDARAEAHAVDPSLPLIVEGAGVLTPLAAPLGDVRVWVQAPADTRRARALARDGETYLPHWERWAAQEEAHIAAHRPQQLATHLFTVP